MAPEPLWTAAGRRDGFLGPFCDHPGIEANKIRIPARVKQRSANMQRFSSRDLPQRAGVELQGG